MIIGTYFEKGKEPKVYSLPDGDFNNMVLLEIEKEGTSREYSAKVVKDRLFAMLSQTLNKDGLLTR